LNAIRPNRRTLLIAIVAASMVASGVAALSGAIAAAVLAIAPAILALVAIPVERRGHSSTHDTVVQKMVEQTEAGRKSVIYDRDTGLFAHWYVRLRGEEECGRAARYKRPLTLLAIEPAPEVDDWEVYGNVALWLRQHMRTVDIAGYLGNSRFVVIMSETAVDAAENAAARLRSEFGNVRIAISSFPEDGATFELLYAAARDKIGATVEQAA
jgi:GGDEF domain-containing protein